DLDLEVVLGDGGNLGLHDVRFRGLDDVEIDAAAGNARAAVDGREERAQRPVERALVTQQACHLCSPVNIYWAALTCRRRPKDGAAARDFKGPARPRW